MKEIVVKYVVAILIAVMHLLVMLSIVLLKLLNGYSVQEFTTLLGIVAPMFSGYTTSVIAFIIKDRQRLKFESEPVTVVFAAFLFVIPVLFFLTIILLIWLKAYNIGFANFEDFKTVLLSIESIFGVFSGMLLYSLFQKVELPEQGHGVGQQTKEND